MDRPADLRIIANPENDLPRLTQKSDEIVTVDSWTCNSHEH